MKKVSITSAISAIQHRFAGLADILDVDSVGILNIICKDIRSGKFYEVFSNSDWTGLKIKEIKF